MREEMIGVGLWLDNAQLTSDQTVTAILERRAEAIIG